MKYILAIIISLLSVNLFSVEVPAALQGTWKVVASSADGGKTIKEEPGWVLCVVRGTSIMTANKETRDIKDAYTVKPASGEPITLIYFKGETMNYSIQDMKTGAYILQVFDKVKGEPVETVRYAVQVLK